MRAETNPPSQSPHSLEDLLRVWGLHRAPFVSDDKSPQLFPASGQSEILDLLHTTATLRGLMLLTGNPGAGKSTLLKSWIAGLEPKRFLPLLITQSSLSATGVLEVLLAKLGERPRFKRSTNLLLLENTSPKSNPPPSCSSSTTPKTTPPPPLRNYACFWEPEADGEAPWP